MIALGRGQYPYECIAKDQLPDAMVYECPICRSWCHDGDNWSENWQKYQTITPLHTPIPGCVGPGNFSLMNERD